jgi:hypothetical protein
MGVEFSSNRSYIRNRNIENQGLENIENNIPLNYLSEEINQDENNIEENENNSLNFRRLNQIYLNFNNNSNNQENNRDHWLFGGVTRPIISSLYNSFRRQPPEVHQITTVKSPINLNKNSLQLIPIDENNKHKYKVHFLFDSSQPCLINIYYAAKETFNEQTNESFFISQTNYSPLYYEKGLSQIYEQPSNQYLDISIYKEEELLYNAEQNYYPVVIVLQVDLSKEGKKNVSFIVSQTTFAALIHCSDDSYVIKPIKQKILFNGKSYIIHEIFGLENGEMETSRECVICMTEPRDTAVLPCRHMCLCSGCAEVLRHQSNKCPLEKYESDILSSSTESSVLKNKNISFINNNNNNKSK